MNMSIKAIIFSIVLGWAFLIFISFPDPYTFLPLKILALIFLGILISVPAFIFHYSFLHKKSQNSLKTFISFLFPITWIVAFPWIYKQSQADALGILSVFCVLLVQVIIFAFSFVILDKNKKPEST